MSLGDRVPGGPRAAVHGADVLRVRGARLPRVRAAYRGRRGPPRAHVPRAAAADASDAELVLRGLHRLSGERRFVLRRRVQAKPRRASVCLRSPRFFFVSHSLSPPSIVLLGSFSY